MVLVKKMGQCRYRRRKKSRCKCRYQAAVAERKLEELVATVMLEANASA